MTELDQLIAAAFASQGKQDNVNKVYLCLLRTSLFLPVKKDAPVSTEEPFSPLFARIDNQIYMMAFDTLDRLIAWAGNQHTEMAHVAISGRELIRGINEG